MGSIIAHLIYPGIKIRFSTFPFSKRVRNFLFVFLFISFIIAVLLLIFNLPSITNQEKGTIVVDIQKILAEKRQTEQIIEFHKTEQKKDSLIYFIQSYYKAYCSKDSIKLDSYYSYPLERYYTFESASKKIVHNRTKFEWNHPKYKNCNPPSKENIEIKYYGRDTTVVSILLAKTEKNSVFYTTIKLNKEWKIYWMANTILWTQGDDEFSNSLKQNTVKLKQPNL